jgi:hypothetical protein
MAPQSERNDSQSLLDGTPSTGGVEESGQCFRHEALSPQKAREIVAREQSFVIREAGETTDELRSEMPRSSEARREVRGEGGVRAHDSPQRFPATEEVTAVTKGARAGTGRLALRGLAFVENHRPLVMLVCLGFLFFLAAVALASRRW